MSTEYISTNDRNTGLPTGLKFFHGDNEYVLVIARADEEPIILSWSSVSEAVSQFAEQC